MGISKLITNVSHDLRTPLTSIIGYLGLVEQDRYHSVEEARGYVHTAYKKARQMKLLVDDLFEYTTVRQTDTPLNLITFDMVQLLEQLAIDFQIEAALNSVKDLDPYKHAENYAEFWNRVESGLLQLLNKHAGTNQNILVVCHGMTIRNLLHGLIADFDKKDALDNASVSIVQYQDGHFQMSAYNQTHHFSEIAEEAAE